MKERKQYEINHVADLLEIPEDKIDAALVDLKEWYILSRNISAAASSIKIEHHGFNWIDDGISGVSDVIINGMSAKEMMK